MLSVLLVWRLRELLYRPSMTDSVVFGLTIGVVLGATLVASAAPSWRAVRVDPVNALRAE
jgi:ABC-type lipoprotein release transport system permease subunit